MAWTCYGCFECDTSGCPTPDVCPKCGEPITVTWQGTCSSCPYHENCIEDHPERWE